MKRILFITASRLGDGVISLSVLEGLRQKFPSALFTIACGAEIASLFEMIPQIEHVIGISKKSCNRHWLELWQKTHWQEWFLIVDLRGSPLSFFLKTVQKKIILNEKKQQLKALSQLEQMNFPVKTMTFLKLTEQSQERAKSFFEKGKIYIALAPTAGSSQKCWPIAYFTALADRLKRKGFSIALFYGFRAEEQEQIAPFLKAHPDVLNLGGGKKLEIVSAFLKQCAFFVGNDSGLMHLSAALDVPSLGLFGPSNAKIYAPRGKKAYFLEAPGFSGKGRMSLLSVQRVEKFMMAIFGNLKISGETI